jgi:hypothetical protein
MQDYLDIVTSQLDADLVSPVALSCLPPFAQILPASAIARFECRLGANPSRLDYQVRLPCLGQNLPDWVLTTPTWQFVQNFYRTWALPNSSLRSAIEHVGIEFELKEPLPQIPVPWLCLQFNPKTALDTAGLVQILQLLNDSVSPLLAANLQCCVEALPVGATISHLGAMPAHSLNSVRLNVKGIAPGQLADYLCQIGWQETAHLVSIASLTDSLSGLADSISLSFDVGDTLRPQIGLKCFLNQQPYHQRRWEALLDYLIERELCTPTKKHALLNWTGFSQSSPVPDRCPSQLSLSNGRFDAGTISLFSKWISHIKVLYQPDQALEANAYLGFSHSWFDAKTFEVVSISHN